jgi:heme/copper-type cytochrome/quinol oxidase subunit 2
MFIIRCGQLQWNSFLYESCINSKLTTVKLMLSSMMIGLCVFYHSLPVHVGTSDTQNNSGSSSGSSSLSGLSTMVIIIIVIVVVIIGVIVCIIGYCIRMNNNKTTAAGRAGQTNVAVVIDPNSQMQMTRNPVAQY